MNDQNTRIRRLEEDVRGDREKNEQHREVIHSRLNGIQSDVTEIKTILQTNVVEDIQDHAHTIYGSGGDPGLKTTVDRNAQRIRAFLWVILAVVGAGIPLVVRFVWEVFLKAAKDAG